MNKNDKNEISQKLVELSHFKNRQFSLPDLVHMTTKLIWILALDFKQLPSIKKILQFFKKHRIWLF